MHPREDSTGFEKREASVHGDLLNIILVAGIKKAGELEAVWIYL